MHCCARRPNNLSARLASSLLLRPLHPQRQFSARPTCRSFLTQGRSTMVTATPPSSSLGPAPWRQVFLEHAQKMESAEFSLGTVRKVASSSPGSGITYAPRTRTCVFRGLFAGLPVNPKNDAELNPDVYDSDFLTLTTDRRMDKMAELFGVESGKEKEKEGKLRGSGGAAPVEAVFWVKETRTQWRFKGKAYVLAPNVEQESSGKQLVSTLTSRMRRKNRDDTDTKGKEWSFAREITAHFGNLSPLMRGSFRNPPPGTPVAIPVDDDRLRLGQQVTDLDDEVARSNFRLVVIVPDEVDRVDLNDPEHAWRWSYTYVGEEAKGPKEPGGVLQDGWEKVEVWP